MKKKKEESVLQWMLSDRLYEKYFIVYALIMAVFFFIGVSTLGFELEGRTPVENLILNVLWCFVLTLGMALAPFWHRLLFGPFSSMLQRGAQVYDLLDEVRDDDEDAYKALKKELAHTGKLPPGRWQIAAMAFIGWYLLFEFCLAVALVKDYQLVWEPQWLQSLIEWGIENTRTPAEPYPYEGGRHTLYYADFTIFNFPSFSTINFANEMDFLRSPSGHALMTLSLWRLISFPPLVMAYYLVFSNMLGWLGLNGLNVKYSKGIIDFVGRLLFNFFMLFFLYVGTHRHLSLSHSGEGIFDLEKWASDTPINIFQLIMILISIIMIIGWFSLFLQIFIKLKALLTPKGDR